MPILEIEIIGDPTPTPGLARILADAAATVLAPARQGATWVRLRRLHPQDYAENGADAAETPWPVFVRVLVAGALDEAARAAISPQLCSALAQACGRPEQHVHLIWEPPAAGRVAFGGRLVPSGASSSTT